MKIQTPPTSQQQDANTKKCCFTFCEIEDDTSMQLKDDCYSNFKIGFDFSEKKKRKYKTFVPRWFYDFNPRDLQFDAKCLICSLSLCLSICLFLVSFTISHTRTHHVFRCIVASFPSCIIRI